MQSHLASTAETESRFPEGWEVISHHLKAPVCHSRTVIWRRQTLQQHFRHLLPSPPRLRLEPIEPILRLRAPPRPPFPFRTIVAMPSRPSRYRPRPQISPVPSHEV